MQINLIVSVSDAILKIELKHDSPKQMIPLERFNLDHNRIHFLTDDEYTEEIFFVEGNRKVGKTNVISINSQKYECPVDLREKTIQVRYNRSRRNQFIVYFDCYFRLSHPKNSRFFTKLTSYDQLFIPTLIP